MHDYQSQRHHDEVALISLEAVNSQHTKVSKVEIECSD
jgi:hypothetical protein